MTPKPKERKQDGGNDWGAQNGEMVGLMLLYYFVLFPLEKVGALKKAVTLKMEKTLRFKAVRKIIYIVAIIVCIVCSPILFIFFVIYLVGLFLTGIIGLALEWRRMKSKKVVSENKR